MDLAWRFALSRKGVVAGIPPSFLDLLDKAIEAAKRYRPATEAELEELKQMAVGRPSIFAREERRFTKAASLEDAIERGDSHLGNYYDYV